VGKAKAQTIGYHYLFSLYWGLCRGPINELVTIKSGDMIAWQGNACSPDVQYINKPDLFGGEKKEGGIQGPFAVFQGDRDQVLPGAQEVDATTIGTDVPDKIGGFIKVVFTGKLIAGRILPAIKSLISPRMSEMRGVVTLWFDGLVTSMNPYPKEWKFRARRSTAGWMNDNPWYPEKAAIYMRSDSLSLASQGDYIIIQNDGAQGTVRFNGGVAPIGSRIVVNGHTITIVAGDVISATEIGNAGGEYPLSDRLWKALNRNTDVFGVRAERPGSDYVKITRASKDSIHAMNGAHIIMEASTNAEWGRGLPFDEVDENSFIYAANRLCAEGFGLCIAWYRKEEIDQFIQTVLDYIGGVTYTDRESGKLVLKLIRDDYVVADLPLFTPDSGLLDIVEDTAQSTDTAYNEVIVTGHDPLTDQDISARAHNLAARIAQGAPATLDLSYPGIPTVSLCARVAQRDMRVHAGGLKKFDVRLDRRAWRITVGSVIRIADPRRGLDNVVLRVGEIDDGNMLNGEIKCKAVQDVFGLPATAFTNAQPSTWSPPDPYPVAAEGRAFELSYRDLFRLADPGTTVQDGDSFLGVYAAQPKTNLPSYDLLTKPHDLIAYEPGGSFGFTGNFILNASIGPLDTVLHVGASQEIDDPDDIVGGGVVIDDEVMRIDGWDSDTRLMTVARGAGDTIPAPHAAGTRAWLTDDDVGSDEKVYAEGESVDAKVLPRSSSDVLLADYAPFLTAEMIGRAPRPYPPADVRILRSHAHWRVLITKNSDPANGQTALSQLRFFGPGDVELTGTLTADSESGGYELTKLNSPDPDDQWASAGELPHWIRLDLADEAPVMRVEMVGRQDYYSAFQTPDDWTLQYSDDGEAWTDWVEVEGQYQEGKPDSYNTDTRGPTSIFNLSGLYPEPTLTWVGRNRITQQDHLVGHTEGNILEEPGTTYEIEVYAGDELLATYAGIEDHFFKYGAIQQAADGAAGTVRLRLVAVRDGLESTAYETEIVVPISTGYGIGYGLNYGGVDL
jgi:hypothetical protein